jgi:hypothetical protein
LRPPTASTALTNAAASRLYLDEQVAACVARDQIELPWRVRMLRATIRMPRRSSSRGRCFAEIAEESPPVGHPSDIGRILGV